MLTPTPARFERFAWTTTLSILVLALIFMVGLWN
ncbi:hypothetical protein SAXI111661_09535 [Saccharomonospora xinjiangensis]|nr:hypothetical protein EYD13_08465 [Saccharomonospora xinjiangensis]